MKYEKVEVLNTHSVQQICNALSQSLSDIWLNSLNRLELANCVDFVLEEATCWYLGENIEALATLHLYLLELL